MRVLILRNRIEPGGANSHILWLSKELVKQKQTVFVAAASIVQESRLHDTITFFPVPLSPSNIPNLVRSTIILRHFVKKEHIDIIHSHHRFSTIAGSLVSKITGVPLVVTVHEFKSNWRLISHLWMGDITITQSQAIKDHLIDHYGYKPENILVIPNAIDLNISTNKQAISDIRSSLGCDSDTVLISYVGRLSQEKGVQFFLESITRTQISSKKTRFIVVGDGPDKAKLIGNALEHDLDPSRIFIGYRKDIPDILGATDIIVLPSLSENFPLIVLEALRAGKPVIATKVGGLPEIIENGITGLLVEPKSSIEIADALKYLIDNPEERIRIGREGLQLINDKFTPNKIVTDTIAAYNQALEICSTNLAL